MSKSFTAGFGKCGGKCGICCYGAFCTPCLYGENVAKLEGNDNTCACCLPCCAYYMLSGWFLQCFVAAPNRKKIRSLHGLEEKPCSDCCVHFWCSPCAVCQEAREIEERGVAPTAASKDIMGRPVPVHMSRAN